MSSSGVDPGWGPTTHSETQSLVALALATVWSGYASFVVHQPAQTRALEARLPTPEERGEYLRESRKWD